jgi:hypothetical protein
LLAKGGAEAQRLDNAFKEYILLEIAVKLAGEAAP